MIKRIPNFLFCCVIIAVVILGPPAEAQQNSRSFPTQSLKEEVSKALTTQLLHCWYPRAIDREQGGFLSSFQYDWSQAENQNKMIVTQARHVWTTAKAAAFFPEDTMYRQAAAHGFQFLQEKMWDHAYGGFFNLVNRQGEPLTGQGYDRYKRVYGNAFGIYALAAYYALSQDEKALDLAKEAFLWLDRHAHDALYGGYFSSLTREGQVILDDADQDIFQNIQLLYKEQNTSIHLLEAFTELYRVWPDSLLEKRLQELLQIIRDKIATEPGYLQLYSYRDWQPVSLRDSAEAVRQAHDHIDYVSFGHDIETAFLMLEASEALGKFEWDQTMKKAKMMVDHTIANGFDPERSGIYDGGYYYKGKKDITITDKHKNWWSQSEGLNALLLFSRLYPKQSQYQQEFLKLWNYTKQYIIDQEHGGWYPNGIDTDPEAKKAMKGHIWKSAYHNGRALMNISHMLEGKDILSGHP